jgi:hypothetical protein
MVLKRAGQFKAARPTSTAGIGGGAASPNAAAASTAPIAPSSAATVGAGAGQTT